jgi:hypothetical protein
VDWYYRVLSSERTGKPEVGYRNDAAGRVVSAWQNPWVGDIVADGPPGTAYYVARNVEPYRAFVLYTDTHLRYLVPARLRDDPRLGIFGEISAGYLLRGSRSRGRPSWFGACRCGAGRGPSGPTPCRSCWSGARPSPPGASCRGQAPGRSARGRRRRRQAATRGADQGPHRARGRHAVGASGGVAPTADQGSDRPALGSAGPAPHHPRSEVRQEAHRSPAVSSQTART